MPKLAQAIPQGVGDPDFGDGGGRSLAIAWGAPVAGLWPLALSAWLASCPMAWLPGWLAVEVNLRLTIIMAISAMISMACQSMRHGACETLRIAG
ncbi:MAG: hypothetical protein GY945_06895 [Rhodobacteraceae bacterium]|nr:hypothetical protein [Paracoccaceae bacterium]